MLLGFFGFNIHNVHFSLLFVTAPLKIIISFRVTVMVMVRIKVTAYSCCPSELQLLGGGGGGYGSPLLGRVAGIGGWLHCSPHEHDRKGRAILQQQPFITVPTTAT